MGSPPSSFQNVKDLKFVIRLANGNFTSSDGNSNNTITLKGLRASVHIDNAGGAMMGTLRAQIYGVTASHMNDLTSLPWDISVVSPSGSGSFAKNLIQVFAIDGTQETLVYNGDILNCWGDYTAMPNTFLYIQAQIGYAALVQTTSPLSIASDTDVGTVMQQIATAMGYQFENNGVKGTVAKGTYLANTLMEQARNMMQAYKFWMYLDNTSPNTLAIAPYGQARNAVVPLVSPQTGLQGYPIFNSTGVNFTTDFNPDITFGGTIKMDTSIPKARGNWVIVSMSHELSSQTENGPWKTIANGVLPITGAAQVGA